ncbi:hypothetical protein [Streptococcus halichoeri]|uniref:hypothetical protein n=1 Tax=Streptococcus halichoeri TaxID=254785 RepID=UPI00135BF43D|nr:hypothetical protein [Streptococcus halichoeri]
MITFTELTVQACQLFLHAWACFAVADAKGQASASPGAFLLLVLGLNKAWKAQF